MSFSIFDSEIYGDLLSDPEVRQLLSDETAIARMLRVEAAIATTLGEANIIPAAAGLEIAEVAGRLTIEPQALREATTTNGVPVVALVEILRANVSAASRPHVHFGATSQDIIDTATSLLCKDYLNLASARLDSLLTQLIDLADRHRQTRMVGRTRGQPAVPISFGLKVATWTAPLLGHRDRVVEIMPRLLQVQFGGAAGNLSGYGDRGPTLMASLATALDLTCPDIPWHNQRENIAEFGNLLAMLTASVGKIGGDIFLLAQAEIREISLSGGASSAMPHKNNPIAAERLMAAAQIMPGLQATLLAAMTPAHERGGPEMIMEWAALPQMMAVAAGALKTAIDCLGDMTIDGDRMAANAAAYGDKIAGADGEFIDRLIVRYRG